MLWFELWNLCLLANTAPEPHPQPFPNPSQRTAALRLPASPYPFQGSVCPVHPVHTISTSHSLMLHIPNSSPRLSSVPCINQKTDSLFGACVFITPGKTSLRTREALKYSASSEAWVLKWKCAWDRSKESRGLRCEHSGTAKDPVFYTTGNWAWPMSNTLI